MTFICCHLQLLLHCDSGAKWWQQSLFVVHRDKNTYPLALLKKIIYFFSFGCAGSLLLCEGFLLQWLLLWWSTGSWASVVVAHGL